MRLLSPTEVVVRRRELRDELAVRVSLLRKQDQRDAWPVPFLDVLVVYGGDSAVMVWDIRQQESDCFDNVQTDKLAHPWRSSLAYVLSESLNSAFVEAIKERFPETKKLLLGQSVTELGKGKAKAASKPAAAKPAEEPASTAAKPAAKPAAKKPAAKAATKGDAKKKR